MNVRSTPTAGTASGVPFLAFPPITGRPDAPVIVAWHLMDPPRTEAAFAAAVPLEGLDAWRIYFGLPLCGSRLPEGGFDEIMRLGYEDAVTKLHGPVATGGAAEFPAAFAELRARLGLTNGPLGLVGGSIGSAVAQLALLESGPAAGIVAEAAVLISPVAQLSPVVAATGRRFGFDYAWHPASLELAQRLDFVDRADEFVAVGQPAVRLIVGSADDAEGFVDPAQRLRAVLADGYDAPSRVDSVVVDGMPHGLTDEPGLEPAPQNAHARTVDRHAVEWLEKHLVSALR